MMMKCETSLAITAVHAIFGVRLSHELCVCACVSIDDHHQTTPVVLAADGDASWLLLSSSLSIKPGSTVQPESIY